MNAIPEEAKPRRNLATSQINSQKKQKHKKHLPFLEPTTCQDYRHKKNNITTGIYFPSPEVNSFKLKYVNTFFNI